MPLLISVSESRGVFSYDDNLFVDSRVSLAETASVRSCERTAEENKNAD